MFSYKMTHYIFRYHLGSTHIYLNIPRLIRRRFARAMKLCEYSSDNTAFVLLAYFGALLPWAILPVVDPLGRNWITFRRARCYVVGYFFISFIPYGSLIPYAILQNCSQDPDRKEFLMAIVTILVSFINTWRAWRGIFALLDVREMWQVVEVKTMEDYLRNGYSNDMIEYVSEHIPKPLSDVSVSNYLIDNDFPGEAPRVIYRPRMQNSWPFMNVKVQNCGHKREIVHVCAMDYLDAYKPNHSTQSNYVS